MLSCLIFSIHLSLSNLSFFLPHSHARITRHTHTCESCLSVSCLIFSLVSYITCGWKINIFYVHASHLQAQLKEARKRSAAALKEKEEIGDFMESLEKKARLAVQKDGIGIKELGRDGPSSGAK